MITKSISSYTKEVNGRQIPTWNPAEVEEIVTSQVFYQSKLIKSKCINFNYPSFELVLCLFDGRIRHDGQHLN